MKLNKSIILLFACLTFCQAATETVESTEARAARWLTNRLAVEAWQELVDKWDASKAEMTAPIENLSLPVDVYPDGRKRIVLVARRAQILSKSLVFAEGVRIEMFATDGKSDGILLAEDCLLNQSTKRGYCRGLVDVKKGTDHIKGRGMMFSADEKFIKILSECEIRTKRIPERVGRLP
jgi:lipopolysaccharide assembly outer membrane protein LptD (OstA)